MLGELLGEAKMWFSVFQTSMFPSNLQLLEINLTDKENKKPNQTRVLQHFSIKKLAFQSTQDWRECLLSDESLHMALLYLFRKGSREVKKFNTSKLVQRVAIEVDGILLSKDRILDGMNFRRPLGQILTVELQYCSACPLGFE